MSGAESQKEEEKDQKEEGYRPKKNKQFGELGIPAEKFDSSLIKITPLAEFQEKIKKQKAQEKAKKEKKYKMKEVHKKEKKNENAQFFASNYIQPPHYNLTLIIGASLSLQNTILRRVLRIAAAVIDKENFHTKFMPFVSLMMSRCIFFEVIIKNTEIAK